MRCQKVRIGCVHVSLPMVLQAIHPTVCLILHEHPHELDLGGQQILNADWCTRWRSRWVDMQGLPTTTPVAYGSLRDVKSGILGGSGSHHLS
jgi:hypothetical protein